MQKLFPAIWNVLHDGSVQVILGTVPGDVRVHIGIEYLRERFPGNGDEFIVSLEDCVELSFVGYGSETALTDLKSIANLGVTILSAQVQGDVCHVFTDQGELKLQARGGIALDSGNSISLEELLSVADAYWDEWEAESRRDK